MAASQWPSAILGDRRVLAALILALAGLSQKRENRRKLLPELKQCFLHMKLRALVVGALPFYSILWPQILLKKPVPLGT